MSRTAVAARATILLVAWYLGRWQTGRDSDLATRRRAARTATGSTLEGPAAVHPPPRPTSRSRASDHRARQIRHRNATEGVCPLIGPPLPSLVAGRLQSPVLE